MRAAEASRSEDEEEEGSSHSGGDIQRNCSHACSWPTSNNKKRSNRWDWTCECVSLRQLLIDASFRLCRSRLASASSRPQPSSHTRPYNCSSASQSPLQAIMSSPSRATEAPASRKRPRHFRQGPGEAKEEQRDEISAATQPPVARLHKHALESIFAFLSLEELSAVLAVSHSWSSAVGSMRSISAVWLTADWLFDLSASRLARHIGVLGLADTFIRLRRELLYIVSLRMSGLHSLYYRPASSSPIVLPPLFPPSLTLLGIDFHEDTPSSDVNSLMAVVARIPNLRSLALYMYLPDGIEDVSFAPLVRSAHLRELDIGDRELNPQQLNEIRALPSLASLKCCLNPDELSLLLRPPHQLRLQKLQIFDVNEKNAQLLASLPSLTDLEIRHWTTLACLRHVPNLRILALEEELPSSPEAIIAGVDQCKQLTSLSISGSKLTCAHMTALLSCMPALSTLKLVRMPQLESLRFLSSEPLQRSLTSLSLTDCRHAALLTVELRHVFALQQLTHLRIRYSFAEKLNSLTKYDLQAPSLRLPKLIHSEISEL